MNQRIQEYPGSCFATQVVLIWYKKLIYQNTEICFSVFVLIIVLFKEQKELNKSINTSINNAIQYSWSTIIGFGSKLK